MTRDDDSFLRTECLIFRRWKTEDLELAQALWGDPRVTRWIEARPRLSEDDVRQRLAAEVESHEQHAVQYWPIFERSGDLVGCCGLRLRELGVYEIGFHICPSYWRKGFASEAARAVIAYAFDALKADALFAGRHPENEASHHLLVKLDFRASHVETYPPTGRDHPCYSLTSGEWRNLVQETRPG